MSSNFKSKLSVFDDSDGFNCDITLLKLFMLSFNESFNEFVKFENSLCIILVNDSLFVILDFNVSKSVSGVIPEHPNTAPVINAK